jgi:hypothetical protein
MINMNKENKIISNKACINCEGGVIMKQLRVADFEAMPCDCAINDWFNGLKR